jgi:hypothetical protein
MASGIDVASVIGTWLAAGLGLLALFGIIAPWILWRTLRSERHIALKTVDDRHGRFLSRGLRIGWNTRILERVKAPGLTDAPNFPNGFVGLRLDHHLLEDPPSKTGWVWFCLGLQAFSLPGADNTSGNLVIRDRETWLPVHRLWILAFGLLGRYGERGDKGRKITHTDSSRLDHMGTVDEPLALYGNLGIMKRRNPPSVGDIPRVYLEPYNEEMRLNLRPDAFDVGTLFWLSLGCLPLGDKVFNLGYLLRHRTRSLSRESETLARRSRGISTRPIPANFKATTNTVESSTPPVSSDRGQARDTAAHGDVDLLELLEGKDAVSCHDWTDEEIRQVWNRRPDSQELDRYMSLWLFESMENILTTAKWCVRAEALGWDMTSVQNIHAIYFDKLDLEDDFPLITEIMTCFPRYFKKDDASVNNANASEEDSSSHSKRRLHNPEYTNETWVTYNTLLYSVYRGKVQYHSPYRTDRIYIRRVDLQSLSLGVLSLSMTPLHFLYDLKRTDLITTLLTRARKGQTGLRHAVETTRPYWQCGLDEAKFDKAMDGIWEVEVDKSYYSRRESLALYELDDHICRIFRGSRIVRQTIGILYISSPTFRYFIEGIGKSDEARSSCKVRIDMSENEVQVNVGERTRKWYLGFHDVFPKASILVDLPPTDVSLAELILASLQAWARVAWFAQAIDSEPLLDFVDDLDELVHISARTEPPSSLPAPRARRGKRTKEEIDESESARAKRSSSQARNEWKPPTRVRKGPGEESDSSDPAGDLPYQTYLEQGKVDAQPSAPPDQGIEPQSGEQQPGQVGKTRRVGCKTATFDPSDYAPYYLDKEEAEAGEAAGSVQEEEGAGAAPSAQPQPQPQPPASPQPSAESHSSSRASASEDFRDWVSGHPRPEYILEKLVKKEIFYASGYEHETTVHYQCGSRQDRGTPEVCCVRHRDYYPAAESRDVGGADESGEFLTKDVNRGEGFELVEYVTEGEVEAQDGEKGEGKGKGTVEE